MAIPQDVRQFVQELELTRADPIDTTIRTVSSIALFAVLLVAALATAHPVAWIAFWLGGAVVFCGAFAAVHEAIHGSLYHQKWANDLAGVLWGLPILNPYVSYRSWHFQHHVYTRTKGDTEPALIASSQSQVVLSGGLAMIGLNLALWVEMFLVLLGRPRRYAKRTARPALAVANLAAFVGFASVVWAVFGSWRLVAAVWLIPAIGGSVLSGLAVSHEHLSCVPDTDDAFLHSRTVKSNRFARFFLWNANYHTGHHLVPTVTGRNLALLQTQIDDRCVFSADSFSSFYVDVLRNPRAFHEAAAERAQNASATETVESDAEYGERAGNR